MSIDDGPEEYQARLQAGIDSLREDLDQVTQYDLPAVTETVEEVQREVRDMQTRVEQTEDDILDHDGPPVRNVSSDPSGVDL